MEERCVHRIHTKPMTPPPRRELIHDTGAPVAKTPHQDEPKYAFDNDFDFRPKKDLKGCPFAAHIRKMRPRADKKRDYGSEKDDENHLSLRALGEDEVFDEGQKEDASVILRRGITFGPELTEEEIRKGETIEQRGMYFTCYQSLIRDGFNFLMTRRFYPWHWILLTYPLKC